MFSQSPKNDQSLYSKQRKAGKNQLNESTLLNHIHKHCSGGLGADTLTLCELTHFFSGKVMGGGAFGFFKG
jgi:hypothetical protein